MHGLAAADVLALWERCLPQSPGVRAVTLLALTDPDADPASLPVGRRDAALLALHTAAFGGRLAAVAGCPGCGEWLDLGVDAAELAAVSGAAADPPAELTVRHGGHTLRLRLPTAGDLAAAPADGAALLASCVLAADHDGVGVDPRELPAEVRRAAEERLAAADPGAELELELTCPSCDHRWREALDPVVFLWAEVDGWARRLAGEVHALAAAYGWGEAEILALSPWRRRLYLDAVAG
jgi:hypothetical protein